MRTAIQWGTRSVLLLIAMALLVGCVRQEEEGMLNAAKSSRVSSVPPKSGKSFVVGISLGAAKDDFTRRMAEALRAAAARNDLTLDLQFADRNRVTQQQQIAGFLGKGVNAILLCPTDSVGADDLVLRANAAKIPIFTACDAATQGTVVTHFAYTVVPNPERFGATAIETVARYLRGEKTPRRVLVGPDVLDTGNVNR